MAIPSSTSIDRASVPPATPADALNPARRKTHGQSLAEFALTVPFALLMVLFGLDFGRVFLGWVALNSAAREAANFAAMNPTAWTLPYNLTVQAEYTRLVETEASNINCTLVSPIPAPTFGDGTSIGAPATVALTCQFDLITPFIGLITGNPIPVSASSAFPIRSGNIEGIPVETTTPTTPTDPPTDPPGASAAPTAAPTPTPAPTATPATCTVVSLLNLQTNKAAANWLNAGFSGGVIFSPLVPPNYKILWQNLTVGTTVSCSSGITVSSRAP
jgi:Flp pilus assembly protein TadG